MAFIASNNYWHNKKCLVTGGAGFVGSYLVELLLEKGARVTVIDDLSRGRIENLSRVIDSIQLHELDMRNIDHCRQASSGQDVVMNLASPAFGIEYSQAHHGEMLTDVAVTGFNALRAAWLEGVKRFLVVSSSCVYPDDATIPTREAESLRVTPEYNIVKFYGKGKSETSNCFYNYSWRKRISRVRPTGCKKLILANLFYYFRRFKFLPL